MRRTAKVDLVRSTAGSVPWPGMRNLIPEGTKGRDQGQGGPERGTNVRRHRAFILYGIILD